MNPVQLVLHPKQFTHIISVTLQMLPALQQLSTFRESAQSFALALEQEPEPVHSSTILS